MPVGIEYFGLSAGAGKTDPLNAWPKAALNFSDRLPALRV